MGIKKLDKTTSEQIAAGEVVENPASVVKELIENALDAGASRVEIKLAGGGRKMLKVIDNGTGIAARDLPMAFQRFATSKLSSLDDLERICSLGFRGEALPSIAAVTRVTMLTRARGAMTGSSIILEGGKITSQAEMGAPEGTAVEVKDLFYNTPGRLKFLRSDTAETARVTALVSDLALAHPRVAFILSNERTHLLQTSGDGNLLHAIGAVYGRETASTMLSIEVKNKEHDLELEGYISDPVQNRSNRRYISVTINGRPVKSPAVTAAVLRGYGSFLPKHRFPVAVLHLRISPALLDVNVHPAKTEVRFQSPEAVKELVYLGVRNTLHQPFADFSRQDTPAGHKDARKTAFTPWMNGARQYVLETPQLKDKDSLQDTTPSFLTVSQPPIEKSADEALEAPGREGGKGACRLIGQFLHSYIVAARDDELLLIDQHAAHERVIYEKLVSRGEGKIEGAQLTVPLELEVPAAWREPLEELKPYLEEIGVKVESFGDNSYIIRSIPFSRKEWEGKEALYSMLEELVVKEFSPGENQQEKVMKTVACHGAIKAHQPLSDLEMEILLEQWENTPGCSYCPHGRPVVQVFHLRELEKGFQRKGGAGRDG